MLARDLAVTLHGLPIAVTSRRFVLSRPSGRPALPMTADVDVRSQGPSWIHSTPITQQGAGTGEASNPRQQHDASLASAPTKEAPNGSVETTIPTTHSQALADETNNIAVESPVTQPQEDSYVPVPGSRKGKRIYYLAPVQFNNWTQECYNQRFLFVKKELQSTVNGDPHCRDLAPYISYELRMVGVNRDQAVPSILINCRERDTRSLKSLFDRANKKLGCSKVPFKDRWFRSKPPTKPPLLLVYCGFKGGPVTRKMSDESLTAYFANASTYCGGLFQYRGASATLGPSLHIDGINVQLTVDHVFRSKQSAEPIAISAAGNSPSDPPHTTLDDVDMYSLNDLCENDRDDVDSPNALWENDDDEYDYEDEPESGVEDETSDPTFPEVDTATMKLSQQWEKMIPPEMLNPSLPYLDWALARPLPQTDSPPLPIGFVNAFFPDDLGGRPVVIGQIRDEPPVHLAPVYVVSGVRGVLCGHILASSTFLGSPAQQADGEVWTVILKSPQGALKPPKVGLISGECGSVVVDQKTHEAYGHVIGCNHWGHAFVAPLRDVVSQVKVSFRSTRVGLTSLWDAILALPSQSQQHEVYRPNVLSFIKQVLATGEVEVNLMDDRGQTPLHRAVREGNGAVAELLLEHAADKEVVDDSSRTPLHYAAREGHEALARLLLEHGAGKEVKDYSGRTPLHHAAKEGNEAIAGLLLEHGADKEAKDHDGWTSLHRAVKDGNEAIAGLLLEHGADKEVKDYSGWTPLHHAAKEGNEAIAGLLLEYGADKEAKDHLYQTPLYYAMGAMHIAVVRLLTEHRADKEAKGGGGQIPLYLAAEEGDGVIPSNVQAPDHLHRALCEIDGFIAGMRYLDETEPLEAREPGYGSLELVDPSRATTPPPLNPQSAAWSSIRVLRDGIQYYWQIFVHLSQKLDDPIINNLYRVYKDARGLREAGVFAFRNTLIGLALNDLRKVFAFCSLSYVISRLLHARGRFEKTEIMAGVSFWLHALEIPREQEAFKILARSLWSQTRHFDFSEQDPTIQGLDFSIIGLDDTLLGQLAGLSPGDMTIVSPDITEQPSSIPGAASIWMNDPGKLHDTKVFVAVVQYCHDNEDFWYNLSNQGAISKDMRSLLDWNQECAREKKLIYEQYFKHLLLEKDTKDVASRGIVSVAEGFIDIGYLQSTDEAKNYMMKMASSVFTNAGAYDKFITWITSPRKPSSCPTCHREFPRQHNVERDSEEVHNKKVKTEGARAGGVKLEMPMTDSL